MIDRQTFVENLQKATDYAMSWAKEHVVNPLPEKVRYYIENEVYLDKNLWSFEQESYFDDFLNVRQLTEQLLIDGMVPSCVNINVLTVTEEFTIMTVSHNEKLTYDSSALMYQEDGFPPFHALSPILPPNYTPNMEKFDLFWNVKKSQMI